MIRVRLVFLALLFLTPFIALMGIGAYHLYDTGYLWVWWPLLGCAVVAYFLAWRWTRRPGLLPPTDAPPPEYWTERDTIAWEKVDARAKSFEKVTLAELSNAKHFTELSLQLATEVGQVYNPNSQEPFETLTLPEVLACVELAAADLNGMVQKYLPGSHLLRIRDVKRAQSAYKMYKTGQDVYWAGAALFDPISTGLKYLVSRGALGGMMDRIQANIIMWFNTAFIHQLGRYLIELNSGRLKVGVARYRQILAEHREPPTGTGAEPNTGALATLETQPVPKPLTVAILGAVKAGKSSLVNELLGQQMATVDRLPIAAGTRYDLIIGANQAISLLDTSGYGADGPNELEFAAAVEASRDADLILLVTGATNPGRKADLDLLDRLQAWFDSKPHLRMAPVITVVNQVDLLSPKAEWDPPYNWIAGTRPKEINIRECVEVVREQLGARTSAVVPVCGRSGETFGIRDGLVDAVVAHLDQARGAAVLKAFDVEGQQRAVGRVVDQVGHAAQAAFGALGNWLGKKK